MCLFLQNQDFQLHAEFMLTSLYNGGLEAASRLFLVNASIAQQVGGSAQMFTPSDHPFGIACGFSPACSTSYAWMFISHSVPNYTITAALLSQS